MKLPILISERIYVPKIHTLDGFYENLRDQFTYKDPTYAKLRNLGKWVGGRKQTIETWANVIHPEFDACLSLPRGGMTKLRNTADEFKVDLCYLDKRFSAEPIEYLENDVVLWPEQERLVSTMFESENCLIRAPTASGKTEAALKLAELLLKAAGPVLIIVWEGSPRSGLMKQWIDRISQRFNIPPSEVGIIGSGKKTVGPITVAMQQTLANVGRLFIHKFGSVICDEVQRFAAPTFQKVIDIFPARFRFGISADETRRDQREWLIYDAFGEVVETVDKSLLIARNKIVEPVYRLIPTETQYSITYGDEIYSWNELPPDQKDFNKLLESICWDEERNDLIWHFLKMCLKVPTNTIVMATHRVEHAKYWSQRILANGYTCGLLLGGTSHEDEFETTSNSLRERKIRVGVGTIQKITQGHDIPAINRGFILTPLAGNRQQFEQLCGRFRRTCEGKKDAIIYYPWDQNIYPQDKKRLMKRYQGYVQEFVDGEFVDR